MPDTGTKGTSLETYFRLRKMCANCPFRRDGHAIPLNPGRLEGIVDDLLQDDMSTFQCHKTVHCDKGGEWDEDYKYLPSGHEAMCAGAMGYLYKAGRPTVAMRMALALGLLTEAELSHMADEIIDLLPVNGYPEAIR